MIECRQMQRVSAYYDGELSEPSRGELEEHLRECPVCAAELSRLRKLSGLLCSAGRPEMPSQALERLHRSVDLLPQVGLWRTAAVFAGVAASILLVCGAWLWRISSAGEPADQIPLWETAAVAPQDLSAAASQEQLAQWVVQDLSWKNGHD